MPLSGTMRRAVRDERLRFRAAVQFVGTRRRNSPLILVRLEIDTDLCECLHYPW